MQELANLERHTKALLELEEYPEDFSEQLEKLVSERHERVKMILADQERLSRETFEDVQQRTRDLKVLLEQNKARIRQKLLTAKQGKKSVSVYKMYQK
ncbi:flagellar biosynthesis protein FliS [Photobacterium sp. ZSDE20]|uniref:Flagellar biosynthesis protein FliS n=1 Tax=Photobacterium pectinilyticum TaxID=2906793 RepID=A0ABT1N0N0_9GAMM|nr:flagellar biosynthesis protein FliS [Photobacterium sp. ZSDE20]MCQ1058297.1 flagellar biosynthesis protein FliS [Photobacterium sp. ZSDE20]MDD1823092.1 flagellar biosynthesis protein FliS [Photobacterium sp. ZSDE20]